MAEEAELNRKMRRAAHLLLLQRHRAPGVKGWELKRSLGKDYVKIIELLDAELSRLDLKVKAVPEEGAPGEGLGEDPDRARFFIVTKSPPPASEAISAGWRIDDAAILAAALAYVVSRRGKAPRREVERLLMGKMPRWRVDLTLDRYIRFGYLLLDGDENLSIGWRTRAEIDQKALLSLLLATPSPEKGPSEGS